MSTSSLPLSTPKISEPSPGQCTLLPLPRNSIPTAAELQHNNSSSESCDSSFDEPADSEILKIQKITSSLTDEVTQKLKKYKKIHKVYMQQSELLGTQAENLQEQKKFIGPITKLRDKTCEINEKLQKACQISKILTEDDQISLNDVNLQDILTNLHSDAELQRKNCFSPKEGENSGEGCVSSQTTKENNAKLEEDDKRPVCSCLVI